MRIDDEHDLRERLDRAFETINPRPAPVEGAVRRGKTIRLRRRVAAAVGAAAIVASGGRRAGAGAARHRPAPAGHRNPPLGGLHPVAA
ncbi:MAG TPA: hypothetical protein VHO07_05460 [Streptosporangiaceae bacterium]|nr:hypothetical protein [Streptosporangiaceae bacterium]